MEYWEKCVILEVPKSKAFYYRGERTLRKMIAEESKGKKSKELTNRLFEIWDLHKNDIGLSEKEKIQLETDKELLSF